ncbi:MAG: adenylosuccinate lyase [Opitutales bacterium]|nr:adenylosuccinate lyase [Opitutales bacterium]
MESTVKNILADRYASESMKSIWSEPGKIKIERTLWIAILKAQKSLGLDIPLEVIDSYEGQLSKIDLDSIRKRELVTKHDVKARIDEFCALAGHEHIHKGMTSRDLTENVEQLQVHQSIKLILQKSVACLSKLGKLANEHKNLVITGRSHNVPAQPTTLGKKIAMYGEEFAHAIEAFAVFLERFPVRGLKGAVGTQTDQLTLFSGDANKVAQLDAKVGEHLGIRAKWDAVGQVYPRSLDFELVSSIYQLTAAPSNFARMVRLMAGHETASEGFAKGQTGSSAMPHKMNSRSCERVHGFRTILSGHVTMASNLAGDQWHEGDVSCSVVRRVLLPDACFAIDGLLNTWMNILDQMVLYPAMIESELEQFAPFLMTTTLMMEAVKKGMGRETAHHAIKKHAVEEIRDRRENAATENRLVKRLGEDDNFPLNQDELKEIVGRIHQQTGNAEQQIASFVKRVASLEQRFPEAANLKTEKIL